jgi:hypothetical protein
MSSENLDKAEEFIHMQGGPADPPPGSGYSSARLLAMAFDEIIAHLRETT